MPEWKEEISKRLSSVSPPLARETEIVEELAQHVEDRYQDLLARGVIETQAQRTALEEITSNEILLIELRRIARPVMPEPAISASSGKQSILRDLWQDLRYSLRMWAKNPGFTVVAILTLALGIGANASIFTLINGLLLRPLPYPHVERVVQVDRQMKDGPYYGMSLVQFRMYQRQNQTFDALAAYDILGSGLNLKTSAEPELIQSRRVSADFFRVVGIPPAMGRDFNADDDRPGAPLVAILSYRIWKDLLGGNPAAIGRSVRMGGEIYTVIGITPPNFAFSRETEAWVCLRTAEDASDHSSAFDVIGRLRAGVTREFAKEDLNDVSRRIRQDYPGVIESGEIGALVTTYQERVVGDVRPVLLLLGAAVACVLLIACSNIASLLLTRAVNRRKEIAIRTALGVSPARLIRQLLTESTLLSFAGGAAGLLLSHWCVRLFLNTSSNGMPHMPGPAIDLHVLLFTLALSVVTGLIFGAAPALQLGRLNPSEVLRESGRATASVSTRRIQGFLVSIEISLATILLLGAGLLLSSFLKLLHVDPGFDPQQVLTLKTSLVGPSFASSSRVEAVVRKVVDRLRSLPGVQAVAAGTMLPTEPSLQLSFELPSLPAPERPPADSEAQWRAISPAYFEVMRIPLLQGRSFSEADTSGVAPVAMVNQAFIRKYLSRPDAIGHQVLLGRGLGPQFTDNPRQIVGVVADTRELGLNEPVSPAVFIPLAQVPDSFIVFLNHLMPLNWLIRVSGEPLSFTRSIHKELLSVDPDLVTSNPQSLAQVLRTSLAQQRMQTALVGFFSAAALLLGAIGLYGVLAYSVAERKCEFGIRAALGASPANVLWLVLRESSKLAIWGLAAGLIFSLLLGRLLSGFLFGVRASDPGVYATVVLTLAAVTFIASYLPARRAMKMDTAITLRQ
jgi:putative ABC transport system permease protein